MKKVLSVLLLVTLIGCASINIPNYIQDKHPYKRTLYASFDKVHEMTVQTLEDFGWRIERESDPGLFERERENGESRNKQTLIFTEIRKTSLFVGSRYARMNAYLRETADNATEIEIRYLTVTSALFKSFNDYRNDRAVERILDRIEEALK